MSSLSCGIVGLPNSGKSTLFNALLKRQIAQIAEYPYTTIEPNIGVVEVPDERLDKISQNLGIAKKVPAAIEFIDIAGLVKGAHKGEGLGNQFLAHIREVDAVLHVVRAFQNPKVTHVHGEINPAEDAEVVNLELELAGIKKPAIYILNVSEDQIGKQSTVDSLQQKIKAVVGSRSAVSIICAKLEAELADLLPKEQQEYLKELGIVQSGLDQVILSSYKLLDLVTFFTVAGGAQAQAWPVKTGTKMINAAEVVHTDFARNFIKAEVISWDKLVAAGSWLQAREKGLLKIAGRDEIVADGDVIEFKI